MAFDRKTLEAVAGGTSPSTIRFFRFDRPTVTYGRLQHLDMLSERIPEGWPVVQRPTGGGVVFHANDLCLSLCWRTGEPPLPAAPRDQYRWIHSVLLRGLQGVSPLRLACCTDVKPSTVPFDARECFQEPVGYDVLEGREKRIGGALRVGRHAILYQGSIQLPLTPAQEESLRKVLLQPFQADAG